MTKVSTTETPKILILAGDITSDRVLESSSTDLGSAHRQLQCLSCAQVPRDTHHLIKMKIQSCAKDELLKRAQVQILLLWADSMVRIRKCGAALYRTDPPLDIDSICCCEEERLVVRVNVLNSRR
jgi:hypothetical protein